MLAGGADAGEEGLAGVAVLIGDGTKGGGGVDLGAGLRLCDRRGAVV